MYIRWIDKLGIRLQIQQKKNNDNIMFYRPFKLDKITLPRRASNRCHFSRNSRMNKCALDFEIFKCLRELRNDWTRRKYGDRRNASLKLNPAIPKGFQGNETQSHTRRNPDETIFLFPR